LKLYPQSYLFDNSKSNFHKKKNLFSLPANLHLVTVSNWLEEQVKESFHKHRIVQTIYNGINLEIFKPIDITGLKEKHGFGAKQIILGVANVWSDGKGLNSFIELSKLLKPEQLIILIGLKKDQVKSLPENIIGIERTNSMTELAEFYNMADVFVNPSIAETFGMVTAEAMACGTPSVVYNSSAMPELITDAVGFIVNPNDYQSLFERINIILAHGKSDYSKSCVERAHLLFEMNKQFEEYISLYNRLLNN
jgi:glycosyltransferase involved in cell wall biosynthesis